MNKLVAVTGMPGSGKSVVVEIFKEKGFNEIRFGDVTDKILKEKGMEINEENEARIRKEIREKYGMEAYAILNEEKIKEMLEKSSVVINGLRSYEEYLYLKRKYPDMVLVGVHASQKTRIERIMKRKERNLSEEELKVRDYREIVDLHIGGSIAMSDIMIVNESSLEDLRKKVLEVL